MLTRLPGLADYSVIIILLILLKFLVICILMFFFANSLTLFSLVSPSLVCSSFAYVCCFSSCLEVFVRRRRQRRVAVVVGRLVVPLFGTRFPGPGTSPRAPVVGCLCALHNILLREYSEGEYRQVAAALVIFSPYLAQASLTACLHLIATHKRIYL